MNCWVTETKDTLVRVEHLHQPGEVEQAPREPVDLVDDDAVDLAGLDVGHQPSEGRAVDVPAGEPAVVVAVGQADPPLSGLALTYASPASRWASRELNSCSSPSSVRLPGVDGAPDRGVGRRRGSRVRPFHAAPRFPPRRKNRNPLVWVPVTVLATAVSVG